MKRSARPILAERLARVGAEARGRLDGLSGNFPVKTAAMPFEEYLARAHTHVETDPDFREAFTRAMATYRSAGSLHDGTT